MNDDDDEEEEGWEQTKVMWWRLSRGRGGGEGGVGATKSLEHLYNQTIRVLISSWTSLLLFP